MSDAHFSTASNGRKVTLTNPPCQGTFYSFYLTIGLLEPNLPGMGAGPQVVDDANATIEQKIAALQNRVTALEIDRDRFMSALKGAAEMCLKNPLVLSMLPKQMKEDLKAYLGQK
jgi:hypothetical protein